MTPVAVKALDLALELGIPAYMNRYIERAVGDEEYFTDLETTLVDDRFAGFDLYESACFIRATADGSRLEPYKGTGRVDSWEGGGVGVSSLAGQLA